MDTLVSESLLIEQLSTRNERAFEIIFKRYYTLLHAYAFTIVKEENLAQDIVQQVFMRIWNSAGNLSIQSSIAAYLYRAVFNESMNHLKHQKLVLAYEKEESMAMKHKTASAEDRVTHKELESKLRDALNALPEHCRTVFQLSRFENLRYQEIADKLGISIKTVENQMSKALKILRIQLIDLLPFILFYFIS